MRLTLSLLLCLFVSSIVMGQAPVADFSISGPASGCSPVNVTFTDQSTGPITSWNWSYTPDGVNNTLAFGKQPINTSLGAGTWSLTLTVIGPGGVSSKTVNNFITVYPSPTISFSADKYIACAPALIQFTNRSFPNAGTIQSMQWTFGDNSPPSTATNPTHTYTAAGYYNVGLTVTNSQGCSSNYDAARYIRVVDGVKANFDFTGPPTCTAPFAISFKNQTSGPGNLTYQWDLGNGTFPTTTSPTGIYNTGGSYTVKLSAQSDFGCSDAVQKTISFSGNTTSFTAPASICIGSAASFQSTSSPAPVNVSWDFGDGSTSNQLNPSKAYNAPGTYTVRYYTTFANCSDSAIKTIVVNDKPVVTFDAVKKISCKPFTVNFQNTSPDVATAAWNFGDGTTSNVAGPLVNHTYTSTGNFDVTLTITDSKGCTNTITTPQFIKINPPVVQMTGVPSGLCVNQFFGPGPNVTAIDGVASYLWSFGDGTTSNAATPPVHSYLTPGNKTLTLTVVTNDGCTATGTSVIQVGNHPVINFTADKTTACRTDLVTFTNTSPTPPAYTDVKWNFGDGTFGDGSINPLKHKFADTGLLRISLTLTSNGCTDSLVKINFVYASPPLANFGYKIDCASKTIVTFSDSSKTDASKPPLTYLWSFGDPANSTSSVIPVFPATIQFTYPLGSTAYNVKLKINNGTCSDSIIKTLQLVNETPAFTINKAAFCRNENIVFTSPNNPAYVKKFEWVLDGVPFAAGAVYTTRLTDTGQHKVHLTIYDVNDCALSSTDQTFRVQGVTAGFTVNNNSGCEKNIIVFNNTSVSTGTITKWTYDFGDGAQQSYSAPPFSHKYTDTGSYRVKLTALDNIGCLDSMILPVLTITDPHSYFTSKDTVNCPGAPMQFIDSSIGKGISYQWYFGDGNTSYSASPFNTYPNIDTSYTVILVVKDAFGCADTLTRNNYIKIRTPKPLYSAKDTVTLCPPLNTKFYYKGKDAASVLWDFGDGTDPSTLYDSTNHFYNFFGNYVAKLYVYGNGGCVDSASINIRVTNAVANTVVTVDSTTACNELTVKFNATIPFGTIGQFYFGDGAGGDTLTSGVDFSHLYNFPNVYTPVILLSDNTGCQTQVGGIGPIDIKGGVPIFGKDKSKFCDSSIVAFTDYSQSGHDPIIKKTWDFGDGTVIVAPAATGDQVHDYTQPGLYVPTLTVSTAAGCDKAFTDTIRVLATPKPIITSVNSICNDLIIDFKGSLLVPPDTAIVWKWDLSNGITSSQQNVSLNYPDTGLHHITLEATNSLGCKGDTSKDITVFPLPAATLTGDTSMIAGAGGFIIPLSYSANASVFNWTPATYLSCADCPNPFANPKFTTTYHLKITDLNGCISDRNITLVVLCNNKNFFIPNTFSPNNDGANDRFYPRGKGLDHIQALRIFNRWGEMVFEKRNFPANDASSGWDGMYKGKTAASDTYVYMIDIICENATIITYKGNITLIR